MRKITSVRYGLLAAIALASFVYGPASATPVIVPDYSFEDTAVADGATTGAPNVGPNWSASGNGGVFLRNPQDDRFAGTTGDATPLPATADGTNYVDMGLAFTGRCWQDMGNLQSNTTYTLTVAVGQDLLGNTGIGKIALVNGVNAFGTVLASTAVDSSTVTAGAFSDFTVTLTTGQHVSGHLTLLLQGDSGARLLFDNVRLDATAAPQSPTTFVPSASPTNYVYVGTLVTLTEDPAGALPFFYQWQTDGGSGGINYTNIGANSPTNVVDTSGFTPGSPVLYRVVVTNSFGMSTSAPVTITAINGAPVVTADTRPVTGSDVVGNTAIFTASFVGTLPITYQWQVDTGGGPTDIPNATNATLILTNIQTTDSGSYSLLATNLQGSQSSTPTVFAVNAVPAPNVDGIITAIAEQTGAGGSTAFSPTWIVSTNSLIWNQAPSAVGTGNFSNDGCGVVAVLTDGAYGTLNPPGNGSTDFVTCGINNNGGASVTYDLPVSATGYDVTNLVVYGGWSDGGRDQQKYTVYYSTVASPAVFTPIGDVDFNPSLPGSVQSSTRITLTSTNGALAKNVAKIKLDFNILASPVENGYSGYSEIGLSGVVSAPAPVVATNTIPTSAADVEGSEVTFVAAFSSATPFTYQWRKDTGGGPVAISGATNSTLTLANLQLSDAASYSLLASNASGTTASTPSALTVNSAPTPDGNGVIVAAAVQTGNSPFGTTWSVTSGSLIAGALPNTIGNGDYVRENAGGVTRLTDGTYGFVGSAQNGTMATCGPGAGQLVTYNFTGSASGYDITNIVVYSGWSDKGRDGQLFAVTYSTVDNPSTFNTVIASAGSNPSGAGVPTANRVILTSSTGVLATNVATLKIDFLDAENGWSGYSEIGVFGQAAATSLAVAPFLTADTMPGTGSDVVGSQAIFTASFGGPGPIFYQWRVDTGSGPVDISGATSATLTLNNLQLTDTASPGYSLQASNANGVATSTAGSFVVNPVPAAVNNVVAAPANQTGFSGTILAPTWGIAPGSLIAGAAPSAVGSGNFVNEGAKGTSALTDGTAGISGASKQSFATCGTSSGTSVNYTLTGSATGYDLINIVVTAGWGDSGRDGQGYRIYYSTVAAPTTFIPLTTNSYNPSIAGGVASADRLTLSAVSGALAQNVAQVRFEFLNVENGWSGYSEIGLFGIPTAPPTTPAISSVQASGGNLIVAGTGGAGASYTILTSTNVALPISTWTTNSSGVMDGNGLFTNTIPITVSDAARFFRIRTP